MFGSSRSFAPPGAIWARFFSWTHPGCFPGSEIQGEGAGDNVWGGGCSLCELSQGENVAVELT